MPEHDVETADPFGLERFVRAQAGVYETALAELRAGLKRTHWMWFIFPQLAGLGHSPTARHYALANLAEARAYLAHPLLGPRLTEAARAVLAGQAATGRDARAMLGAPDDLKLASSMTLFARAAGDGGPASAQAEPFRAVLEHLYGGTADARTLALLAMGS